MMFDQFKSFLLNETKHYLGQRAGDILTALQNLQDDASGMGSRALIRASQGIVNQIRRILRGRWNEQDVQHLKTLQKIGVALMKAIDENQELPEVIASSVMELEGLLDKLQVPINSLGTEDVDVPDETETPEESDDGPFKPGSELGA
jgi:hypothetical protein